MARAPAVQEIEELPEADRLDGFAHPRATQRLYGHEAAERMLAAAFASGRMHHGWLIAGAEGIGKATLAYRLARHVLADPAERNTHARHRPRDARGTSGACALASGTSRHPPRLRYRSGPDRLPGPGFY